MTQLMKILEMHKYKIWIWRTQLMKILKMHIYTVNENFDEGMFCLFHLDHQQKILTGSCWNKGCFSKSPLEF